MRRLAGALAAAAALAVGGVRAAGAIDDQVTLYTPAFEGPPAMAGSVATILSLQIWQTLRRAPSPNPGHLSFGRGVVQWGRPLEDYGHEAAEAQAKESSLLAQLVFWGKVYPLGAEAVAQTHLSIPRYRDFREAHPETWTVQIPVPGGRVELSADLPERRYSFEPIVLSAEVVERYSRPEALTLYASPNSGPAVGSVGPDFNALEQRENAAKVRSGSQTGWVRLPRLSATRSEIVDFVGGLVRVFRGDWAGAVELMDRVIRHDDAPNELKTDAYLYRGLAEAKQGLSPESSFAAALELSPTARRCVVYATLGKLADLQHLVVSPQTKERRQDLLRAARRLLEENISLFESGDPWVAQARAALDRIAG